MTANELYRKFADEFGFNKWPKTYEVDAETYGYVCQSVFHWASMHQDRVIWSSEEEGELIAISLGPNNGIMFKNVELILKGVKE